MNKKNKAPNANEKTPPLPSTLSTQRKLTGESSASNARRPQSQMANYVSFGLLLAVIALVGFFFYEVMISFMVPLFLAAILVVVFRPLHRWILVNFSGRQRTSAILTTTAVLLTVLVPISVLLVMAMVEGREVVRQFNAAQVEDGFRKIRSNLRLDLPAARQIRDIGSRLNDLQQSESLDMDNEEIDDHRSSLFEIQESAKVLGQEVGREWPADTTSSQTPTAIQSQLSEPTTTKESVVNPSADDSEIEADPNDHWLHFCQTLQQARKLHFESTLTRPIKETEEASKYRVEQIRQYRNLINQTAFQFSEYKSKLLGGKTRAWLTEMANPTDQEFDTYSATAIRYLRDKLFAIGGGAASFLGNTLLGFAIMIIGLYFFFLDGPGMIQTFHKLSPMDDEHEHELVAEFANISRAVVVATLLSAFVQGVLAGIGFYFAGMNSIFLLTVLSAVLAMVPFVGAAAVWVPCCIYLYFFENNLTAAIGLAVYGTLVISLADNIIKPYVLHGQSNLHPLLALLSVLGGVATLGPIGILVGPMIVVFLQTLLRLLQREIAEIDLADTAEPNEVKPSTTTVQPLVSGVDSHC